MSFTGPGGDTRVGGERRLSQDSRAGLRSHWGGCCLARAHSATAEAAGGKGHKYGDSEDGARKPRTSRRRRQSLISAGGSVFLDA